MVRGIDVFRKHFKGLETEPFDENLLKSLGLGNEEMVDKLVEIYAENDLCQHC